MEHVMAPSEATSACGLLLNPAKVPKYQYRALLCSMHQKFHGDDAKTRESQF
jgi:hypothetical protein